MKISQINKKTLLFTIISLALGLNLYGMDSGTKSSPSTTPKYDYAALLALKETGNLNLAKTALLWDMSGVLLGKNKKAAAAHVLGTPWATIMFFSYIKPELDNLECAEEWVNDIAAKCANTSWWGKNVDNWKTFLNTLVTVSQSPDKNTVKLFNDAKKAVKDDQLGYTAIFSNNGPTAFEIQKKKPEFGFLKNAQIITCSKNAQAKPKQAAYSMAKNAVTKTNPSIDTFILIDDNMDNVKGAKDNGIFGIFYSNETQKASDLRNKLIALGLLANKQPVASTSASTSSKS